jgi:hypothetical protein
MGEIIYFNRYPKCEISYEDYLRNFPNSLGPPSEEGYIKMCEGTLTSPRREEKIKGGFNAPR